MTERGAAGRSPRDPAAGAEESSREAEAASAVLEAEETSGAGAAGPAARRDPDRMRRLLKDSFGGDFWGFFAFMLLTGAAVWFIKGSGVFVATLIEDGAKLLETLPRIVAALGIAGLLWAMLPRDKLGDVIGRESSWRGLFVGAAAGIVTPGGPSSAFPLLALLASAGADRGALVAYITAWSTMGLQRMLVWDVPFMGAEFSVSRFLISLPLPIIAGLIARRIPVQVRLRDLGTGESPR